MIEERFRENKTSSRLMYIRSSSDTHCQMEVYMKFVYPAEWR